MPEDFSNWSGSLRFTPENIARPSSKAELQRIICKVSKEGGKLRPVGNGHSSSQIIETERTLVSMNGFAGLIKYDLETNRATVGAGSSLKEAGGLLIQIGLATHNLGDINLQTVGGAVATGTHGSGKDLPNLATMLVGGKMVTADGEILDFSEKDEDLIRAARVSLGALGIMTEMELSLLPSYRLHRQEWCTDIDHCLDHLDELVEENRNFDFYWYPRSDRVKLRTLNPPGQESDIGYASLVEDITGPSGAVISKLRSLRFDEMEYSMPAEAGEECFREIRKVIKEKHRKKVAWRLLYRLTAPDDTYLSNAYGRRSVSISLHQNNTLPFWDYFKDIEPIFLSYGGRPHWGKKHSLGHEQLREVYPEWNRFKIIREKMDPDGLFLTQGMRRLLGD